MPRHSSVNPDSFRPVLQPHGLAKRCGRPPKPAASSRSAIQLRFGPGLAAWLASGVLLLGQILAPVAPVEAASALLETVKQNPQLAKQLCAEFKQLNAEGRSATSPASLARVASSQGLSTMDAEVLTTYVIGLYCPDVR